MIQWKKGGIIYKAEEHRSPWRHNSALTPTPIKLDDNTIRVFAGFRDVNGISRIGYVDVNADDPTKIVKISDRPALDIGRDGCFDDNGVIMGDVVLGPDGLYMFYVGFQLVQKAKFLAFSGLATSKDGGDTFERVTEAPILDRASEQTTIGAIHSARYENGRWRIWFASGDGWQIINSASFPKYHIRYVDADDLLSIQRRSQACVNVAGLEYRIGRPRVYFFNGQYVMYYTKGTTTGEYFPGVAYSKDGVEWTRSDSDLGIELSADGWDSKTLCYPALLQHGERLYMFYNGNGMGVDGFGFAEAISR